MAKVNTTLSIDEEVKMDFKIETTRNRVDMSETVEQLMIDYVKVSKSLHAEREERNEREEG